jgi:membrane-bound lytic murein transglycosylase D
MARLEGLRPLLDPILRSEEIPLDLAFVVVVESGGKPDALSPKGARGLWQLMPETARRYGLVVDRDRDERLDIAKSTRAAARYLRDLYSQFQSWPVALAAYNAGEQAVQNAIDRAQSNEFSILSSSELLPYETRTYVPAVMKFVARSGGMPSAVQEATPQHREKRIVYAAQASEVRP